MKKIFFALAMIFCASGAFAQSIEFSNVTRSIESGFNGMQAEIHNPYNYGVTIQVLYGSWGAPTNLYTIWLMSEGASGDNGQTVGVEQILGSGSMDKTLTIPANSTITIHHFVAVPGFDYTYSAGKQSCETLMEIRYGSGYTVGANNRLELEGYY